MTDHLPGRVQLWEPPGAAGSCDHPYVRIQGAPWPESTPGPFSSRPCVTSHQSPPTGMSMLGRPGQAHGKIMKAPHGDFFEPLSHPSNVPELSPSSVEQ